MIRFNSVPEPRGFRLLARKKGLAWLARNPNKKRPKDFWSPFKNDLANGFNQLCGYTAMFEPVGTVDHYISCKNCLDPKAARAYSWSNYRFASQWINSSKQNADSAVLDPFKVQNGWFEIILPSLQLVLSNTIPPRHKAKAKYTIERLHLESDERVIRQRSEWYRMLRDGEINLIGLRKKAPLIAEAVEKWQATGRPLP